MTDPNHSSLAGRVAIVTGGGTGIGRGVALALARAGADTVVAARTPEPLEETCAKVRALGRRALAVQTDVTDTAQVGNMVARAMDAFGRVDVLVNNAGGNAGPTFRQRLLLEMSAQDIDETFTVNVRSMLSCSQAVAPIMNRQEQGAIINVASRAGRESTAPSAGGGVYPASKAAVVSLTRLMAVEWAPNIRVNCVAPGMIDTPRVAARRSPELTRNQLASIALGRPGSPEDIAGAVLYLASDAAEWVTGAIIDVHGGLKKS